MTFEQLLELLALLAIIVFPALAVTMRIALKPVIEAILRLSEGMRDSRDAALATADDAVLRRMHDELEEVRQQVRALQQSETFYKSLLQAPVPDSDSVPRSAEP